MLEPQSKLLTTLCFHFCSFRLPPAFGCGFSQNWEQERVQKWSTTSQDKYEKCFKTHDEERQVYKIKDEMAPRSDEELLQAAREYTSILLVRWSHPPLEQLILGPNIDFSPRLAETCPTELFEGGGGTSNNCVVLMIICHQYFEGRPWLD